MSGILESSWLFVNHVESSFPCSNWTELRDLLSQALQAVRQLRTSRLPSGGTPGVDEAHTEIPEMTDIARGDGCFSCECYPRDLSVPYLDRLANPLPSSDDCAGRVCGDDVESEDS